VFTSFTAMPFCSGIAFPDRAAISIIDDLLFRTAVWDTIASKSPQMPRSGLKAFLLWHGACVISDRLSFREAGKMSVIGRSAVISAAGASDDAAKSAFVLSAHFVNPTRIPADFAGLTGSSLAIDRQIGARRAG
jgi:hypothetical protein